MRRATLAFTARIIAQRLNADHSDCQGRTLPCKCGRLARYAGRRAKTFVTALGEMTLKRAYYHCEQCKHGFYPRDRALRLSDLSLSPATMRMQQFSLWILSVKFHLHFTDISVRFGFSQKWLLIRPMSNQLGGSRECATKPSS